MLLNTLIMLHLRAEHCEHVNYLIFTKALWDAIIILILLVSDDPQVGRSQEMNVPTTHRCKIQQIEKHQE